MIPAQKKAVEIAQQVMKSVNIILGQTEIDLAKTIDKAIRSFGAKPAFKTIVGSGINSLDPHARPRSKKIQKGDQVVVDLGANYHGYCSDTTRTFFAGSPTQKQIEIYNMLKIAQQRAISAVKVGVSCRTIDLIARQYLQKHCASFCHLTSGKCRGDCFIHTTGHGIGRKVHQAPRISLKNHRKLKAGEVITVEPGLYIHGWGGMRIEDMVEVTKTGCRVLTR